MDVELPEFVTDPAEVTPEWLSQALRRAGVLATGKVLSTGCKRTVQMVVSYCLHLWPAYSPDAPPDAPPDFS